MFQQINPTHLDVIINKIHDILISKCRDFSPSSVMPIQYERLTILSFGQPLASAANPVSPILTDLTWKYPWLVWKTHVQVIKKALPIKYPNNKCPKLTLAQEWCWKHEIISWKEDVYLYKSSSWRFEQWAPICQINNSVPK